MRELFGARGDRDSRVWNRYTTNTYEQLADREATISSAGLYVGQIIVLEVQNEDGSWPRPRPRSVTLGRDGGEASGSEQQRKWRSNWGSGGMQGSGDWPGLGRCRTRRTKHVAVRVSKCIPSPFALMVGRTHRSHHSCTMLICSSVYCRQLRCCKSGSMAQC